MNVASIGFVRWSTCSPTGCDNHIPQWKLEEEVYMDQPEGCVERGKEGLVCQLKHSLHGVKQAPRHWNSILDE